MNSFSQLPEAHGTERECITNLHCSCCMLQPAQETAQHTADIALTKGIVQCYYPRNCARGKVISSVVVVVVVVVVAVDTNFGISQHQGTCATCKCHVGVATGGKLAPAPSNRFNTTGVCSICRLSDAFCGPPLFARNVKWQIPNSRQIYIYLHIVDTSQAAILRLGTVPHCMVIDCSAQHTK